MSPIFKSIDIFFKEMEAATNKNLNLKQREAVEAQEGPLLIIAGPGSGKTETLVWRLMKLILVDDIPPESIIITTFTEKAANNLLDRINTIFIKLENNLHKKLGININNLRLGTLHSLCNSILREFRYKEFQRIRLMDAFEQKFFALKYCSFMNSANAKKKIGPSDTFWERFTGSKQPTRWLRLKNGIIIFDRLVEDMLDLEKIRKKPEPEYQELIKYYDEYINKMKDNSRCDFANIQKYFLEFLQTDQGRSFVQGDDTHLGIRYVLVDEYQDTNPIQEEIYLTLADNSSHNLNIVGDYDQSMYRFRGSTVDLIVNFEETVKKRWNLKQIQKTQIHENYRSHKEIVKFFNDYLKYHPDFKDIKVNGKQIKVRAPGKIEMLSKRDFKGNDWKPIVGILKNRSKNNEEYYDKIANCVKELIDNKMVRDLSQIVLLLRSTKETPHNAGPLITALRKANIDKVYNPRSRTTHTTEEFKSLIGGVIKIIDKNRDAESILFTNKESIKKYNNECVSIFDDLCNKYRNLKEFVENSHSYIEKLEGRHKIQSNFQSLYYRLLNLEPFSEYIKDPVIGPRYGIISQLLDGFVSVYSEEFKKSSKTPGVKRDIVTNFYESFIGTIILEGLNDFEDEENLIPMGYIQIMTYHQAKGLQFPYVFLLDLEKEGKAGVEHYLEEEFKDYRIKQSPLFPLKNRVDHDAIRLFYVGMSRAEIGLFLCIKDLEKCDLFFGRDNVGTRNSEQWFNKNNYLLIR